MMLDASNPGTVLGWVRVDLDKQLDRIRQQIEHLASNGGNGGESALNDTLEALRQLRLTFEMLMLHGAESVSEEMLTLCEKMLEGRVTRRDAAFRALMDATVVLPSYLDRLQAGHHDLPVLLLPAINELRAAHDAQLLSESTLFAPALDVAIEEVDASPGLAGYDESFTEFATRMRREFESGLLGWLQHKDDLETLEPLRSVCATVLQRLRRHDLRRLWWIAREVMGGICDGVIENDVALRRLFARLHLNLKNLSEGGESAAEPASTNSVAQALLFHVAQAPTGHEGVDRVRAAFRLEDLVPDHDALLRARGAVTGRNRELYVSLGEAVRDELAMVKDALDLELRTGNVIPEKREQCLEALSRLEDTLKMLGLASAAKAIARLTPALRLDAGEGNDTDTAPVNGEDTLMALAEQLLTTESLLNEHMDTLGEPVVEDDGQRFIDLPAHEIRRIRIALLDETVDSLHAVQEAVRRKLEGHDEARYDRGLVEIAGALELIGETETAALTQTLVERMANVIGHASDLAAVTPAHLDNLADAVAALELYLAGCRDEQPNRARFLEALRERLDALPTEPDQGLLHMPTLVVTEPPPAERAEEERPAEADEAADDEAEAARAPEPDTVEDTMPAPLEGEMRDIFLEEFGSVVAMLDEALPAWLGDGANRDALVDIRRGFHTLKGSGRMVGAEEIGEFAWKVEDMLNAAVEGRIDALDDVRTMTRLAHASLPALRERLEQTANDLTRDTVEALGFYAESLAAGKAHDWGTLAPVLPPRLAALLPGAEAVAPEPPGFLDEPPLPAHDAPEADVEAQAPETVVEAPSPREMDPTLLELMRKELRSDVMRLATFANRLGTDLQSQPSPAQRRAAHTITGTLSLAPLGGEVAVARALERMLEAGEGVSLGYGHDAHDVLEEAVAVFQARLDMLESVEGALPDGLDELARRIGDVAEALYELRDAEPPEAEAEIELGAGETEAEAAAAESEARDATPEEAAAPADREPEAEAKAATEAEAAGEAEPEDEAEAETATGAPEGIDPAILEIFLDEAREVLGRSDSLLDTWRGNLGELRLVQSLQREIHTFKGGARMAGLETLGALSHAMETLLERIAGKHLPPTAQAVDALEQACDRLQEWCEEVSAGRLPDPGDALARFEAGVEALSDVPPELPERAPPPAAIEKEFREIPEVEAPPPEAAEESAGASQVRVDADLLDSLVNSAGEISIFRARIEQQISLMREHLAEADDTMARLREQLRKLEMETETQILSRYQRQPESGARDGGDDEAFDPLELDRFSMIQQLSRGLAESVADMLSLQEMLDESARKAEGLLTQQSRVSTDLQEGLMETRMVPFGSIAPRLRRLVRKAAQETGKAARLQLRMAGSSDQLDRNVLERITVPLEHMLRNAVAHGIEEAKARRQAGKPAEGEITVTVESEATEFVIRVEDDGAGIDFEAIRRRAVEDGRLDESARLPRHQLAEMILESGFSTSKEVTGLAGRGVGMDVVNSEIKQIGGSLEIDSEPGKGTRFTIRIPFTLAVMQAIGIVTADERYLIPLASVSGVGRMLPDDYRAMLESDKPAYHFAGEDYPVFDLAPLLGEPSPPLGDENVSLLMVETSDQRAAFRVQQLQGHREVVIKPLGPQVSSVPGILGGTISGDGHVVLILDVGPLIRHAVQHGVRPRLPVAPTPQASTKPLVMVVDDSITMRKVTTRVLENHNFEVVTARDGVDATEQLQDRVPSLMLLDIEMPRMDGYALAEYVRSDPRLKDVPIIMITSRSGEKHKERAREAGANDYLTKPYKEADLVEHIEELLGEEGRRHVR